MDLSLRIGKILLRTKISRGSECCGATAQTDWNGLQQTARTFCFRTCRRAAIFTLHYSLNPLFTSTAISKWRPLPQHMHSPHSPAGMSRRHRNSSACTPPAFQKYARSFAFQQPHRAHIPKVLLLRRVLSAADASFGPVFWAAPQIPPGFEEASSINNVLTLASVDQETRSDIALLLNSSFAPCSGSKCEACLEGCQVHSHTARMPMLDCYIS